MSYCDLCGHLGREKGGRERREKGGREGGREEGREKRGRKGRSEEEREREGRREGEGGRRKVSSVVKQTVDNCSITHQLLWQTVML